MWCRSRTQTQFQHHFGSGDAMPFSNTTTSCYMPSQMRARSRHLTCEVTSAKFLGGTPDLPSYFQRCPTDRETILEEEKAARARAERLEKEMTFRDHVKENAGDKYLRVHRTNSVQGLPVIYAYCKCKHGPSRECKHASVSFFGGSTTPC